MPNSYLLNACFMLIMLAILGKQVLSGARQSKGQQRYLTLCIATGCYVLMDCAFIYCSLSLSSTWIFKVAVMVFYLVYAILPYVWHLFVRNYLNFEFSGKLFLLEAVPLLILLALILTNPFTGAMWSFDEAGTYVRGNLFGVFSVLNLFYYLEPILDVVVVFVLRKKHKEQNQQNERYLLQAVLVSLVPLIGDVVNAYIIPVYEIYPFQPFCMVLMAFMAFFSMVARESWFEQRQTHQDMQSDLDQAQESEKQAVEANEAKSAFLFNMSHDIRTPLNGIIGMLDMAEQFPDDPEKLRSCRQKSREAAQILLDLVNDVLDKSKLESGEIVLEHVPFDMDQMARETFTSVCRQAEDKGIEFIEQGCLLKHKYLIGSPLHYKRIVMNIISNAIKYNREHGKVYITCTDTELDDQRVMVKFRCQDTGIGMSEEFLQHIFEPFTQEDTKVHANYKGTGLGMSIAKELTTKMGGTITVESVKDVGTCFEVSIPFEIDRSDHASQITESDEEQYSIEGLNILVAEDNDLNMEISKFQLESAGAKVLEVHNGQEAVTAFEQSAPGSIDAILMDVMMPVMDGYEATKCIRSMEREDARTVPIIAMTANAFSEDKVTAKQAGMNEHLAKPLDVKRMIKTIYNYSVKPEALNNKPE